MLKSYISEEYDEKKYIYKPYSNEFLLKFYNHYKHNDTRTSVEEIGYTHLTLRLLENQILPILMKISYIRDRWSSVYTDTI